MLLLDKNVEPHKTIFYLSGVLNSIISVKTLDSNSLYQELQKRIDDSLNYNFFVLALDFLFLLDKITINEKGEIEHVY
ncbi:ABC-three component system middle component 6 [Streptococcus pluranimalium]|uniref:ABC-three component system middle component 6 n=1 Tax=Streptococcus pluranimalium TaxID=82348 RepID=UPI0039FBF00D